jgi:hypothetical protein
MQQPERVFAEVYRVLKPGGAFILTFSNRMFYDKVGNSSLLASTACGGQQQYRVALHRFAATSQYATQCDCLHTLPVWGQAGSTMHFTVNCPNLLAPFAIAHHMMQGMCWCSMSDDSKHCFYRWLPHGTRHACWCAGPSCCLLLCHFMLYLNLSLLSRDNVIRTRSLHAVLQAIAAWRDGTGYGRCQLVKQYFQAVQGYTEPEVVLQVPLPEGQQQGSGLLQLLPKQVQQFFARTSSDPFYAVLAYRNFKPDYS